VKSWEIIADNLKKRGWSLGYVSAVDCERQTIWIANAHHGDGKRFVVWADEKLTAFVELGQRFGFAALRPQRVFQDKNSLFVARRMSGSSAAIKCRCSFLDNRKLLEDSHNHCSSNAGVSSEAFESDKRRFTISRRRGTREPRVFLRLRSALAVT
jgi:hypothetical protein